jgi:thiamine kinase-like enzyme
MTQEQLEIICRTLNLGHPMSPPTRVYGGLLHIMWQLDTEKGTFAVKQLSKDINLDEVTRNSYEISENIARQFNELGIPAISSITNNNKSLIDADGNTFIVYPWVNAKVLSKDEVSINHAKKIAEILANMHLINLSLPQITKLKYETPSNDIIIDLIDKSVQASLPFANQLQKAKTLILDVNEKYAQTTPLLNQFLVISHGDLDIKNVLWDNDSNPILIDWEAARVTNPTYEILIAALDWSCITAGSMRDDIFLAMIKAYKDTGGVISFNDLQAISHTIPGYCVDWLVYNMKKSLKNTSTEEKNMGIEQVNQTFQTILYLNSKINKLINMVNNDC